jgi:hypothetical protein
MVRFNHVDWAAFSGQRDGSLLWHRNITNLMKQELGMSPHVPCPCILRSSDNSCYGLVHVDDILVVAERDFVLNRLVKCVKERYEVSTQVMEKPRDAVQFWKRKMGLQHDS